MTAKGKLRATAAALAGTAAFASAAAGEEITIATVNNGDMIVMQQLSPQWEEETGHTINWVVLEENVLRQRVTQDIATQGGQFDILTIGNYEVPIWAKQDWLVPLDDLPDGYSAEGLIPAVREALSVDGTLFALPFYAESAMLMYRTDLAEEAGVQISDEPTWPEIMSAAEAMTDRDNEVYGICLRGKPGWGENMAFITSMANSYGARWFDPEWRPEFDSEEWQATINDYLTMMQEYGPPGASSNGFNETLSLFQQGRCGLWIDATSAGQFVTDPEESTVAENVGFAKFPTGEGIDNHGNWLWSWSLAIPSSTDAQGAAKEFITWATSQEYIELVAEEEGWLAAPPGTRTSLYENQEYQDAASFAEMTMSAMEEATPNNPSVQEVPYTGGQFVAIPEFQGIGTAVGQTFSAALAGQMDADQALQTAQQSTEREMQRAGYYR